MAKEDAKILESISGSADKLVVSAKEMSAKVADKAKTATEEAGTKLAAAAKTAKKAADETVAKAKKAADETSARAKRAAKAPAKTAVKAPAKEEKKAARTAKKAAKKVEKKAAALSKNLRTTLVLEVSGSQITTEEIQKLVQKEALKKCDSRAVKTLEIYLKPEERAAYYVVNGKGGDDYKINF